MSEEHNRQSNVKAMAKISKSPPGSAGSAQKPRKPPGRLPFLRSESCGALSASTEHEGSARKPGYGLSNILRSVQAREEQSETLPSRIDEEPERVEDSVQKAANGQSSEEAGADAALELEEKKDNRVRFALSIYDALHRYSEADFLVEREKHRCQLAFDRYSVGGEVSHDSLHDMLLHLGFLTCRPEEASELASREFKFHTMDMPDFMEFVAKCQSKERKAVHESATVWLEEAVQNPVEVCTMDGLRQFLHTAAVYLDDPGISRALEAGLPGTGIEDLHHAGHEGLLKVLAAVRFNEGLSSEDLEQAKEIFDKFFEEDGIMRRSTLEAAIKVSALAGALMEFGGIYASRHFPELFKHLPPENDHTQGICYYEFIVWLRRLKDMDMKELWDIFEKADSAKRGRLSMDLVLKLAKSLGFTLLEDAVEELLEEIDSEGAEEMDFGTIVRFVVACRECHGFTSEERDSYMVDFEKFDDQGEGELDVPKVLDLLRYMGMTVRVDEVHALIDEVDYNKNGSMEPDEFLMLMRLMREKELTLARKAFNKLRGRHERLQTKMMEQALALVFEKKPQKEVWIQMQDDITEPPLFDDFWKLACTCRTRMTLLSRKRAGFSDEHFHEIERIFNGVARKSRQFISLAELIWMLAESQFPVNTSEGRKDLLRRLGIAREDAIAASASPEEVGDLDKVGFFTTVHLIRGIVREVEAVAMDRENASLASNRFSVDEAAEFRFVFQEMSKKKKDKFTRATLGDLLDSFTTLPVITEQDMMKMLRNIGVKVSLDQLMVLTAKIREASKSRSIDDGQIDFCCFLDVMRWMLDSNYAEVNKTAAARAHELAQAPKIKPGSRFAGQQPSVGFDLVGSLRDSRGPRRFSSTHLLSASNT
jgi:Ca2+-binding EF-hand superfamily protein